MAERKGLFSILQDNTRHLDVRIMMVDLGVQQNFLDSVGVLHPLRSQLQEGIDSELAHLEGLPRELTEEQLAEMSTRHELAWRIFREAFPLKPEYPSEEEYGQH